MDEPLTPEQDPPPSGPASNKKTQFQRRTEKIENSVREEIKKYYKENTDSSDWYQIYAVASDEPLHSFAVRFYKRDTDTLERKEVSRLYFTWDGREVKSYDDYIRFLQDFTRHSQERRVKSWWHFVTSPLSIGGLIGLLLVVVVAVQLFSGRAVPDALWQVLTAVIAFYFGKNSAPSTEDQKTMKGSDDH
jgi:hypothetical protein